MRFSIIVSQRFMQVTSMSNFTAAHFLAEVSTFEALLACRIQFCATSIEGTG
jgi:hypothetical protein